MPLPVEPGKPMREDYHYERKGTCVVLLAVEPLTGRRIVEVRKQKTKIDYAGFMKKVASGYPAASKIVLIQDNLNTHNPMAEIEFSGLSKQCLDRRIGEIAILEKEVQSG